VPRVVSVAWVTHVVCFVSGGRSALKKVGHVGRKPHFSAGQLRLIARELKRDPIVLGYENSEWTAPDIADLIERETGVWYHPGHLWKILRRMG
jgi:transposase